MVVINERMAQFWFCKPQTYGDWSDPTGGGVGRRYTHLLHNVLQTTLDMGQCEGGVGDEIVMEYFFDFFRKSPAHHNAQCLLKLVFRPLFLLGPDLSQMCVRFAVWAALLGQLEGWPSSLALAAFQREIMLFIGKPKGRSIMISNATNPLKESRKNLY